VLSFRGGGDVLLGGEEGFGGGNFQWDFGVVEEERCRYLERDLVVWRLENWGGGEDLGGVVWFRVVFRVSLGGFAVSESQVEISFLWGGSLVSQLDCSLPQASCFVLPPAHESSFLSALVMLSHGEGDFQSCSLAMSKSFPSVLKGAGSTLVMPTLGLRDFSEGARAQVVGGGATEGAYSNLLLSLRE